MQRRWLKWLVLLVAGDALLFWWFFQDRLERSQDSVILAAARRYGVHPALVKAIVWKESRFHPDARGTRGELGLMQIRPPAASEWGAAERLPGLAFESLAHPASNTLAGTWYFAKLLRRYQNTDNPAAYALADYNAGRAHVLRWDNGTGATNSQTFLTQIDFPGTRTYVVHVLQRFRHYADAGFGGNRP